MFTEAQRNTWKQTEQNVNTILEEEFKEGEELNTYFFINLCFVLLTAASFYYFCDFYEF